MPNVIRVGSGSKDNPNSTVHTRSPSKGRAKKGCSSCGRR